MFDEGCLHSANGIVHLVDCNEYAVIEVGTVTLEKHNGMQTDRSSVYPGFEK